MTNPQVESLLEHDSFLRAMARRLLGDDVAADDIVQEAWLVALRSAKRPDEVRAGWLAGIVRNLVRRARRDIERRTRRERVVARNDEVTATDEACAERSLRRKIAEIVVALPGIYREPLILRYYDGLSPQAIAERLALPGSTVRTRIQRGLLRVREGLENGNGNGHALSVALVAIAWPRRARGAVRAAAVAAALVAAVFLARTPPPGPLHVARETVASHAAAIEPSPGSPGVGALSTAESRESRGTVALLLEGIVHLPEGAVEKTVRLEVDGAPRDVCGDAPFAIPWTREGTVLLRATHAESEVAEAVALVPGQVELWLRRRALVPEEMLEPLGAAGEAPALDAEGASGDQVLASPHAPTDVALEGIVRLPFGASARPVVVEAWRIGGPHVRANVRGGERFSMDVGALFLDPRPAELRVRASHPDAAPGETRVDVLFDPDTGEPVLPFVEIELFAPAVLEGVVQFEGLGPAADATVAVFPFDGDAPAPDLAAAARTAADGSFRLVVDRGFHYLVAAAAPGYAPAGITAFVETDAKIPALVLRQGVAITGRVQNGDATAMGATVRASLPEGTGRTLVLGPEARLAYEPRGLGWRTLTATTGGDGAFRIFGLSPRTYRAEVVALFDGEAPPYGAVDVAAPGTVDFDVPVARVVVVVRRDGMPLPGLPVDAIREDKTTVSRVADASGRALFLARPGELLRIRVVAPGFTVEERDVVAETSEILFDLAPEIRFGTIAVAPYSMQGVAIPAAADFVLTPDHGRIVWRESVVVEDGQFVLRDLEPGVYKVVATFPGNFLPASARVALGSGETSVCPLDVRAGGRIVLRFLTDGDLPEVSVESSPEFGPDAYDTALKWTVTGDTIESGLLEPGLYVVHVRASDFPRFFPVTLKPGETVKLLVPIG